MDNRPKLRKGLTPAKQAALAWLIIAVVLLAAARYGVSDPRTGERLHFTLPGLEEVDLFACPFWSITGLPCPVCGITRSSVLMLHGDFIGSFRIHPLGPLLVIGLALIVPGSLWMLFRKESGNGPVSTRAFTYVIIVLILLSWTVNLVRHFKIIDW